jgi:hypothetical protein
MGIRAIALVSMIVLPAAGLGHAQSPDAPLAVFVTSATLTTSADNQTPDQRQASMAEAIEARNALEKSVRAEQGKKREHWPAEVEERVRAAEESAALATARHLYAKTSNDQADSVEDVKRGLTGAGLRSRQEHVVLVETAADAHLIVEIRGRRSTAGSRGLFGRHYFVLFAVKAGPKLTAQQYAAIPRNHRESGLVARPRPDVPEWLFEALGGGSWKVAGSVVASLVDQFVAGPSLP